VQTADTGCCHRCRRSPRPAGRDRITRRTGRSRCDCGGDRPCPERPRSARWPRPAGSRGRLDAAERSRHGDVVARAVRRDPCDDV